MQTCPHVTALEARLADAVAKKLNAAATFSHWIKKSTGDVPVFNVPATHGARAAELGLTVKVQS